MDENPVVFGMLGPFLVTLGFASAAAPGVTLWIDPKYYTDKDGRSFANDTTGRDWSNDR
jgi:hypothetical protein